VQTAGPRTSVAYIAGSPRGGSTLLARLLGQAPDAMTVGELRLIWDRSLIENWACSCGAPFDTCPFWTRVMASWRGAADVDARRWLAFRNTMRTRSMSRIRRLARRGGPASEIHGYVRTMDALYDAIAAEAGVGMIVDSSKAPPDALALAELSRLDFRVVHLVRDPRATVQSWTRRKADPSVPGGSTVEVGLLRTVAMWIHWNLAIRRFAKSMGTPILVRYEDLCRDPDGEVRRIRRELGRTDDVPSVHDGDDRPDHTMAGNPMRFEAIGTIREDDEWRRSLPPRRAAFVRIATWPLLRTFGYE